METVTVVQDRSFAEHDQFVQTLMATPPTRLTACRGWTAHEITAHVAAGSAETADLIEDHLAGVASRPTRGFEERERPMRALDDDTLRERFFEQVARAGAARRKLAEEIDGAVMFTGRMMKASEFVTHSRSERVLHRWDLIGRDDVGWAMLAQPDLTGHAVKILTEMPVLAETPQNRLTASGTTKPDFEIVLRSEPHDDLFVARAGGHLSLRLQPTRDRRVGGSRARRPLAHDMGPQGPDCPHTARLGRRPRRPLAPLRLVTRGRRSHGRSRPGRPSAVASEYRRGSAAGLVGGGFRRRGRGPCRVRDPASASSELGEEQAPGVRAGPSRRIGLA